MRVGAVWGKNNNKIKFVGEITVSCYPPSPCPPCAERNCNSHKTYKTKSRRSMFLCQTEKKTMLTERIKANRQKTTKRAKPRELKKKSRKT